MPWDKLIDAGVIGVVVTLILAFSHWVNARITNYLNRKRNARYLAIQMVPKLDYYVDECAASVSDDGLLHGQEDENGYTPPRERLPKPPQYPEKIDWLSIDYKIMYELQLLSHKAERANRSIAFIDSDVAHPPDFGDSFNARRSELTILALEADKLAAQLRDKYNVPKRIVDYWNPIEYINKAKAKVDEQTRKWKESQEGTL